MRWIAAAAVLASAGLLACGRDGGGGVEAVGADGAGAASGGGDEPTAGCPATDPPGGAVAPEVGATLEYLMTTITG
jgi:hypothetical protein